jgi:hypothetical protein
MAILIAWFAFRCFDFTVASDRSTRFVLCFAGSIIAFVSVLSRSFDSESTRLDSNVIVVGDRLIASAQTSRGGACSRLGPQLACWCRPALCPAIRRHRHFSIHSARQPLSARAIRRRSAPPDLPQSITRSVAVCGVPSCMCRSCAYRVTSPFADAHRKREFIRRLLNEVENTVCADCNAPSPPRALSVTFGVFLCSACAAAHRACLLEVCSVDEKDPDIAKLIEMGGNKANAVYEYALKATEQKEGKPIRPAPNASEAVRKAFVRRKYAEMDFWKPNAMSGIKLVDDDSGGSADAAASQTPTVSPATAAAATSAAAEYAKRAAAPEAAPKAKAPASNVKSNRKGSGAVPAPKSQAKAKASAPPADDRTTAPPPTPSPDARRRCS